MRGNSVNDPNDPFATTEPSTAETARPFPGTIYPNIFLPKKIYEALPAAYISVGTLFILGAVSKLRGIYSIFANMGNVTSLFEKIEEK